MAFALRAAVVVLLVLMVPSEARVLRVVPSTVTALADTSGTDASLSQASVEARIQALIGANPLFSEEACTAMFATKVKLGGPVPPDQFVKGCTEVCTLVKKVKDYWGSGDMANYACGHVKSFGCAWDVSSQTRPMTGAEAGC